jgi:hypothetical protein
MFHQNFLFMKTKSFTLTGHQWLLPLLLAIFLGWSHIASAQTSCTSYSLEFTNNQYGPAGLIFCGNSVSGQVVVVNTGQVDNKGNFVPTTGVTIAYYYTYDNPNLNPNPTWISPGGGGTTGVNLNNTYFKNSEVVWWKAEVTTGSNTCTTSIIAVYKTSVPGITGPDPVTQPNPLNITGPCDACIPFGHGENLTIATPIDHEVNYYLNGSTIPFATKPYGGSQSPLCYTFGYGTFTVTVVATNYCGTTTKSFTVTTYDNTPPQLTGTLPTGQTGMNLCYANLPGGPEAAAIALLYTDNCTDVYVDKTANITGDDCGWSATYTYDVYDGAGNHVTPSPTVVYTGSDQTAPTLTGTPYTDATLYNACYVDAYNAVPAWSETNAIMGYTDNCGANVTATLTNTSKSGDDCGWTVTYTYTVYDECSNPLANQTYTHSGKDQTAPTLTGTPYTDANLYNACYVDAYAAVPAWTEARAITGYTDNCGANVTATLTNTSKSGDDCGWTVTYTYTVYDECLNPLAGQTYSHSGKDQTAPTLTGTTYSDATLYNACYVDAYNAVPAWSENNAIMGYTDNCGANVTATLTNISKSGDDCGWTVTYTYTVYDECSNPLANQTYTHSGKDQTAPTLTGTPYTDANLYNACYVDAYAAVPAWTEARAITGYTDNCGANVTATLTNTSKSGDDCGWTVTYTYTVYDECLNPLAGQTYTHSGKDQTAPTLTGTTYTDATLYNACYVDAYNAVPAWSETNAIMGYTDNCGANVTATLTNTSKSGDDCGWTVTYTYTVYDECLNPLANQSYTHSGKDQTAPVPDQPVPADQVLVCMSDIITPTMTGTDNCGGTVIVDMVETILQNGNGCYNNPYEVERYWVYTDECLNEFTSAVQNIYVEADELIVTIDDVIDPDRPFCNTTGNLLSANDPEGGCEPYTYYWSLSPANEGWVITDGAGDELATPPVAGSQTITYNTGNVGVDITFYVKVVDGNGCIATYDVTFDCQGGAYCTYTQGFYGGLGGVDCENNTTVETIEKAFEGYLPATSVQIGSSVTDNLILNDVDANCIIGRLPGGGSEAAITGLNTCANMPGIMLQSNSTKIANTLVAQAITLTLNIGLNPELPNLVLPANKAYMITIEALDCYNFQSLPDPNGMEVNYPIPVNVTAYLNGNNGYAPNVQGLLDLANDAISGVILPGTPPTLSEITNAMGTINNGFDDCRVIVGWGVNETPSAKLTQMASTSGNLTMFPNPTSGNVSILIPEEGFTHLRVVSFDGKTVKEISQQDLEGQLRITIDMQNVAHGIYYVFAYHNNTLVQKGKLVIVR